uniref:Uncharacterized protein n=1 Tax=Aegilops tauschii TaxID=37682 RepID=M8CR57_AEGTA
MALEVGRMDGMVLVVRGGDGRGWRRRWMDGAPRRRPVVEKETGEEEMWSRPKGDRWMPLGI